AMNITVASLAARPCRRASPSPLYLLSSVYISLAENTSPPPELIINSTGSSVKSDSTLLMSFGQVASMSNMLYIHFSSFGTIAPLMFICFTLYNHIYGHHGFDRFYICILHLFSLIYFSHVLYT